MQNSRLQKGKGTAVFAIETIHALFYGIEN